MSKDKDLPEDVWQHILKLEGSEYTDKPNDSGGPTKYGISQKGNPDLSTEEIKNLTPERARQLYTERYWNTIPEKDRNKKNFTDKVHTGSYGKSEQELIKEYLDIIKRRPKDREHLNGWMNRAVGDYRFSKNKTDLRDLSIEELEKILLKDKKEEKKPTKDIDLSGFLDNVSRQPEESYSEPDFVKDLGKPKKPVELDNDTYEEAPEIKEDLFKDSDLDMRSDATDYGSDKTVDSEPLPEIEVSEVEEEPKDINLDNFLDNMSKAPEDMDTPEFAKDLGEPEETDSPIIPTVEVDHKPLPEMEFSEIEEEPLEPEEVEYKGFGSGDTELLEKPESVGKEYNKLIKPSVEKIKANQVTKDKLPKNLPGSEYITESGLISEESWKDPNKSLDDLAKEMNESIRHERQLIDKQHKQDRDDAKRDKWIIGLALAAQAFANGMAAKERAVPDQIVNGKLVRGRGAGPVKQVDFSALADIDERIKDNRAYRMKRAALKLADAKFRFGIRKDARDLGIREEKEGFRRSEASRKEGKRDVEKLEKETKSDIKEENKAITRSHDQVLKDIQKAKPKKLEETVKNSLIANLGMDPDDAGNFLQERNWLGDLLGSDVYGLGLSDKERETLLKDVRSKMESELQDKPESSTKSSDTLYDPKIHNLKTNKRTGETWIFTKDGTKVAPYGKQ